MILSSISSGAFVKPKTTKNDHRLGHGYGFGNRRTLSSIEKREALIFAANSEKNIVSGSDLLGPGSYALEADDSRSPSEAISAVELKTERDIDFTRLKQLLIDGDFKQADDEARSILLKCAGESAQARGWIYFTEVATIPSSDMKTIDDLWIASSQGKFGYSVQRKVFLQCSQRWTKFFKAIDWTVGEDNNYRKWPSEFIYSLDAKSGHLPVTNCLRGTQLLEALMMHEALDSNVS